MEASLFGGGCGDSEDASVGEGFLSLGDVLAGRDPFSLANSRRDSRPVDPLGSLPDEARALVKLLAEPSDDCLLGMVADVQAVEILDLVRLLEILQVQLLRRVSVFDRTRGFDVVRSRGVKQFLQMHAQMKAKTAGEIEARAKALFRLPVVRDAQASGEITADQAAIITAGLAKIEDPQVLTSAQELLVQQSHSLDLKQLETAARQLRTHVLGEEEAGTGGDVAAVVQSWIKLSQTGTSDNPFWVLNGELSPIVGEKLRTALEAAMGAPCEGELRTHAERMGDAMETVADLALGSDKLPTVGGQRPHLTMQADLDALRESCPAHPTFRQDDENGDADEMSGLLHPAGVAATERGYEMPRWQARKESCDCSLRVILTRGQTEVLSIGRATRTVPAYLRDAVINRDRHCVWPGCGAPPSWCEAHHLIHWADGGETSLNNLALLCGTHHRTLHATGWDLKMINGRPKTVPPPGSLPTNTRYTP